MATEGAYSYRFPRPALTVDALVYSLASPPSVLLIRRKHEPHAGRWALPGGFLEMDETLEQGVVRELEEETGISGVSLEQMHTFSAIDRDPRGRTVTTVFWGETDAGSHQPQGMDDADDAAWWPFDALPPMACDHGDILAHAVARLRKAGKL